MKVSVIVPSYNPDHKLVEVVEALVNKGFEDIIVVNDGSSDEHKEPFETVSKYSQCTLLTHEINKGKGCALKTAFQYVIENRNDVDGVITVDGDNQHRADDIYKCAQVMVDRKDKVILGVRDFSGDDVPKKSRYGNHITSFVFGFACGLKISDTQTGLRAIPAKDLPAFVQIKGDRYEYETNMLLQLKQLHIEVEEVPIQTVYIEDNASSHFSPLKDSLKIYGVIFKFLFSSLAASVIDLALFTLLSTLLLGHLDTAHRLFIATIGARVISSLFNYTFNRKAVFQSTANVGHSIVKYYLLCILQLCVSYSLVFMVTSLFHLGEILTVVGKAVIDIILFLISFQIQRRWVFNNK